jgi:hypothetical protein
MLLPAYLTDSTNEGLSSPIKGYQTACDPVVRAGANGLFYYCGIAFDRSKDRSAVFVARFQDNNNLEKVEEKVENGERKYFGPIRYIDTKLVATGSTSTSFIDMPNLAVDVPRKGALYGNIYVAYTVFSNTTEGSVENRIFLQRSTDGGATWSTPPVQLSTAGELVQRPTIAIDPIDLSGKTVYVAFRRFAGGGASDGIVVVRSTDGGKTFSKLPDVVPSFYPFDQGTSNTSFRTNSYPTMALGDLGTVYLAWSQRQGGPAGQARIMISAFRKGGLSWTTPKIADQSYTGVGHQFMPSLTFSAWRLMLVWYDQRGDEALDSAQYIQDSLGVSRHTIDVRAAEGMPGVPPSFSPSIQVSRYLYILDLDENGDPKEQDGFYKVIQAESNYANYPLFQLGTVPFLGDYIEITPACRILPPALAFGSWIYNINPFEPNNFHAAWADNRDVRPPDGNTWGNWTNYSAPSSTQDQGWESPACSNGGGTGMRNQNIYTANINKGLIMGSPGNTKQLDLPLSGEGGRTFVVFVKNTTAAERTLRLSILQIGGVNASFDQFANDDHIQVKVQPYSSVSTTVYVDRSTRKLAPVTVNAFEGLKLVGYVVLNPDPTNLPLSDPDNPFLELGNEYHDPGVSAPSVWNYDVGSPDEPNPSSMLAPRVQNPRVQNNSLVNPRVQNTGVTNPRVQNESVVNNEVPNPRVQNTGVQNTALTDVTWTVTNEGNTTSAFSFNIISNPEGVELFNQENPPLIAQVLVYRVHRVPIDKSCQLYETHQDELIVNASNPRVQNPRVQNIAPTSTAPSIQGSSMEVQAGDLSAQDVTFYLAPDEQADVIFRVWDPDTTDASSFTPNMVSAEAVAEAVDTEDVQQGGTDPSYDTPPNNEPWVTPSAQISTAPTAMNFSATAGGGDPAPQTLDISNLGGGTLSFTIEDDATWLSVDPTSGTAAGETSSLHTVSVDIAGLAEGTYTGTITISDPLASNNPLRVPVSLNVASFVGSLVAYYPFNGNANDESGNGNNGTVYGATLVPDRFGNPDSAYAFNGDGDYILVPDSGSFNFSYPVTLSAWIYLNDSSAGGIVGQWGYGGESGDAFIIYVQGAKLGTYLPQGGDLEHIELLSSGTLDTGQWYHVGMVSTGSLVTLYINGNSDTSEAITVQQVDSSQAVKIGLDERFYPDQNYLNGSIDDLRIYNRALTPSEIQALYNPYMFGQVSDPAGDAYDASNVSPDPDLVSATGTVTGENLILNVQFAPNTFSTASSGAQFMLDTDRNPQTGHPGVNAGCQDDASLIGNEYVVDMNFYNNTGQARLRKNNGTCNSFSNVGVFDVVIKNNGMEVTIPLALLGSADGRMNFKVASYAVLTEGGGTTGVLDYMTDIGLPVGMIR